MDELLKKERDFVVPGDEIVRSLDFVPGKHCFRNGDAIVAKRLGLVSVSGRIVSVIPLSGRYVPQVGDMVIGKVVEIQPNGWILDISAPYDAYLPLSGVREYIDTTKTTLGSIYGVGDYLYGNVHVASGTSIHISMQDTRARKLTSGQIVSMSPAKVPRLIGKQGSMIIMIKNKTNTQISVGQNGLVWVNGDQAEKVKEVIQFIEAQAHAIGLTDRVAKLLGGTYGGTQEQPQSE